MAAVFFKDPARILKYLYVLLSLFPSLPVQLRTEMIGCEGEAVSVAFFKGSLSAPSLLLVKARTRNSYSVAGPGYIKVIIEIRDVIDQFTETKDCLNYFSVWL